MRDWWHIGVNRGASRWIDIVGPSSLESLRDSRSLEDTLEGLSTIVAAIGPPTLLRSELSPLSS